MLQDHTIRDRIRFRTLAEPLRKPAFDVVTALQRYPADVQVDAAFLAAVALATTVNLDPHDLVSRARRLLADAEGPFTDHLQAIRDYAKGELR